jgi:hypothetical protein
MIGHEFPAVLAAARGDEEAFGRLWRDLQPRLLRYFAVAAPAAAEDLASETWLAVIRTPSPSWPTRPRPGCGRPLPASLGCSATMALSAPSSWRSSSATRVAAPRGPPSTAPWRSSPADAGAAAIDPQARR